MKKSIVAGLIVLALIVLISPGIVGYLAERSVARQVEWAADENREFEITATGFERGWFSSAGRHRIEFAATTAGRALRNELGFGADGAGPAILIDTTLDHGIVPVTSLGRANGSLMPGLGRATSQISFQSVDGEITALPGVVETVIGLTGTVSSHYALAAGAGGQTEWGDADFRVDSNARERRLDFSGRIDSFLARSGGQTLATGRVTLEGDMQRSPWAFYVGDVDVSIERVSRTAGDGDFTFGPMRLHSESTVVEDRIDSRFAVAAAFADLPGAGDVAWTLEGSLDGLDAPALGRVMDGLERTRDAGDPGLVFATVENDLKALVASGLSAEIDPLDVEFAEGTVRTRVTLDVAPQERDSFLWTSLLLSSAARADVAIPVPLFDAIVAQKPEARAALAAGFLVRNGENYEMVAEYRQGLLTVNDAPVPIPLQ